MKVGHNYRRANKKVQILTIHKQAYGRRILVSNLSDEKWTRSITEVNLC